MEVRLNFVVRKFDCTRIQMATMFDSVRLTFKFVHALHFELNISVSHSKKVRWSHIIKFINVRQFKQNSVFLIGICYFHRFLWVTRVRRFHRFCEKFFSCFTTEKCRYLRLRVDPEFRGSILFRRFSETSLWINQGCWILVKILTWWIRFLWTAF